MYTQTSVQPQSVSLATLSSAIASIYIPVSCPVVVLYVYLVAQQSEAGGRVLCWLWGAADVDWAAVAWVLIAAILIDFY